MKKSLTILTIFLLLSTTLLGCNPKQLSNLQPLPSSNTPYTENGLSYIAKVDAKSFYFYKDGQWQQEFIKGVNMGVGVPGKFPGEMAVTKDEYQRWFKYIGDMKANTLRVYTILSPVFYDAFYEYNQTAKNKIFLIQGLWINEDDMLKYQNAYAPQILDTMKDDTKKIIGVHKMQRPVAFTNWVTTDMLVHTNEPAKAEEDSAIVDPGHIKATKDFKPGLFASYHIYPYYPDFMNYQKETITYKNKDGKIDTYKAYLADLIKQHDMPVLVAEYGVPASRGMTHISKMGFNQGMLSENDQGTMDAYMLQDIYDEGYAGALVFT